MWLFFLPNHLGGYASPNLIFSRALSQNSISTNNSSGTKVQEAVGAQHLGTRAHHSALTNDHTFKSTFAIVARPACGISNCHILTNQGAILQNRFRMYNGTKAVMKKLNAMAHLNLGGASQIQTKELATPERNAFDSPPPCDSTRLFLLRMTSMPLCPLH